MALSWFFFSFSICRNCRLLVSCSRPIDYKTNIKPRRKKKLNQNFDWWESERARASVVRETKKERWWWWWWWELAALCGVYQKQRVYVCGWCWCECVCVVLAAAAMHIIQVFFSMLIFSYTYIVCICIVYMYMIVLCWYMFRWFFDFFL